MTTVNSDTSKSQQVKKDTSVSRAAQRPDPRRKQRPATAASAVVDDELIAALRERAESGGVKLAGEDGLLAELTKRVLEAAFEGEMADHLGYDKHDAAGRDGGNSRNGHRAKTVQTDIGPVTVEVPRDRDGSFEPKIVAKRQRRLSGVEEMVCSLSAKGLTSGEISAHLAEVYGASVSKETISTITDAMLDAMREWQNRPLDEVYPVIFIDAIRVKVREGTVTNRPIYIALAVTVEGMREILGIWAGEPGDGEGAKYWLRVLTEIRNRGVKDTLMVVCDGLKGLPESIEAVWPDATVQTCIVHLLRNTYRYASKRDWDALRRDLKPVYQAQSEADARAAFENLTENWGERYPTIVKLWDHQWATFVPFLAWDVEIRKLICSTNAIESVNARIRRAVNARGHFPTEAAALKCVYMALMALDPKGTGQKRWSMRWKIALQAFETTFPGRLGIDTDR